MATRDTGQPAATGISRRDFLKVGAAATAVAGCGLDFAYDPAKAAAYENMPGANGYTITSTTCPYCSASCGQRVVVANDGAGNPTNTVVDIYGDFESPMNSGGLCAKGAGALQLVNNPRRIGVGSAHGNDLDYVAESGEFATGVAYKRLGATSTWTRMGLDAAMTEIASGLVNARGFDTAGWDPGAMKYNSKSVAFFGSSHMNNEQNYLYRKMIANFGTSNTEHQARI